MKTYTYQIGKGLGDELTHIAYSQEVMAYSQDEAVDKAKAVTRSRPPHGGEDIVRLLDETRTEGLQVVWARSAKDVRDA